jgi:UDP-N-acetylmuramoyl-tripeptide--D-alanyl-D-alanine ligase
MTGASDKRVKLEEIRRVLGARPSEGGALPAGAAWTGDGVIDSRAAAPGDLFFALPGERTDGHLFVQDALSRGAAAAVVSAERSEVPAAANIFRVADPLAALQDLARWYRGTLPARIVAVTGSTGKTTTKEMIAAVLSTTYRTHASSGNRNNHIGLPLTLLGLRAEHEVAVVEMGASRRGEIAFLCDIARPEAGVITGVSDAHLETFGRVEDVLAAKWELAEHLEKGGMLFLNGDDARLAGKLDTGLAGAVRYGLREGNDFRGRNARPVELRGGNPGASMRAADVDVHLELLGRGALYAALAALAVGIRFGVSAAQGARALGGLHPLPGRLCPRRTGETVLLDDTYNSSPQAVVNALEVLAAWPGAGRRIVVLGDMLELGDASESVHREAGRRAGEAGIDLLFTWGDWSGVVVEGARGAGMKEDAIHLADSREAMARELALAMGPGDVILLKASRGRRLDRVADALLEGGA